MLLTYDTDGDGGTLPERLRVLNVPDSKANSRISDTHYFFPTSTTNWRTNIPTPSHLCERKTSLKMQRFLTSCHGNPNRNTSPSSPATHHQLTWHTEHSRVGVSICAAALWYSWHLQLISVSSHSSTQTHRGRGRGGCEEQWSSSATKWTL